MCNINFSFSTFKECLVFICCCWLACHPFVEMSFSHVHTKSLDCGGPDISLSLYFSLSSHLFRCSFPGDLPAPISVCSHYLWFCHLSVLFKYNNLSLLKFALLKTNVFFALVRDFLRIFLLHLILKSKTFIFFLLYLLVKSHRHKDQLEIHSFTVFSSSCLCIILSICVAV